MSLSLQATDRLFERLHATYGRDFMSKYEGLEVGAVKASWAHELSGFANNLHPLAWALENLPERAPNVIEFRKIARQAPRPEVPYIEHEHAGKARIATELAKLAPVVASRPLATHGYGNKSWAYRIIANDKAGMGSRSMLPLIMARAALERYSPELEAA